MDKKSAFFIILSVAILAVMLYLIGIDKVVDALENANLFLIALAVLIQFGTYFLHMALADSQPHCRYQRKF